MATLEEPSVDTILFWGLMRHVRNSRVIQKLRVVLQDKSRAQQGLLWFQGVIILVRRQKSMYGENHFILFRSPSLK